MRPYGFAFLIALVAGKKEPPPSISVLLLPAKSAEPPQSSGIFFASALIAFPDAARVASCVPASKTGSSESQPAGSSLRCKRFNNAASLGLIACQVFRRASQSLRDCAPRSLTLRTCAKTSAGSAKCSSGFKPKIFLVSAISSAPRAEPCEPAVPFAFGAGQAITECIRINDGLVSSALAAIIAASTAGRSMRPSAAAGTSITCQPYAR